ncbi:MAG TPA: hypothetical protein VIV60_24215, partial [Polyangiaceae bacterium]
MTARDNVAHFVEDGVDFDIEKPHFRPRTLFAVRHLIHVAHVVVPVVAIIILGAAYFDEVGVRVLNDGTHVLGFPPPHVSWHHWETFVGLGLLLLTVAAASAERLVR